MKKAVAALLFTSVAAFGAAISFPKAAIAGTTSFECSESNSGILTTYAISSDGNHKPVIRWVSHHFSWGGYTPYQRCQEVSARMNRLYQQGRLNGFTSGWLNGQPVICANSYCSSDTLLFTLRPDQNPWAVLSEVTGAAVGASSPSWQTVQDTEGVGSIDLEGLLENQETEVPADSEESPES
jgi:Circadian oscillating protein COP23